MLFQCDLPRRRAALRWPDSKNRKLSFIEMFLLGNFNSKVEKSKNLK